MAKTASKYNFLGNFRFDFKIDVYANNKRKKNTKYIQFQNEIDEDAGK